MPVSQKTLVITPTYNEKENIERIIQAALSQDPRVEMLIVDDNSPDGTGDIVDRIAAANPRVHVLHRSGKLGLGTAYIAGFKWALERDFASVMEMDADFSHDPGHIPTFLKQVEEADLVLGSRYRFGKVTVVNWPITRLLLSFFANVYARIVTGLPLYDSTGGFKIYRRQVLEAIDLNAVKSNGYAFQIEMSFRAWKKGFRIIEIPIVFTDRSEGQSKMSRQIVWEAVWMCWKLRFWSMTGRIR
jgi:dolichol-phosphate mannosyltransferase